MTARKYRKVFDATAASIEPLAFGLPNPDKSEGKYVFSPEVELAINVALVTGRVLLVRGEPGSGKSSLAEGFARLAGWRLYEYVVTSRTEAQDLLWRFDTVGRLADAHIENGLKRLDAYVEPGILWWAVARGSARRRGSEAAEDVVPSAADPAKVRHEGDEAGVVVLIDEIDKADADVPNNLLEVLGARTFRVRETDKVIEAKAVPLVIVCSNEERSLPDAFLRRCVTLWLPEPTQEWLTRVATAHFSDPGDASLVAVAVGGLMKLREDAKARHAKPPSTAELLDLLRAAKSLGIRDQDHPLWRELTASILWKHDPDRGGNA